MSENKVYAACTGQKVVIEVKDCATFVTIDDTFIEYPMAINLNVDTTGIPVLTLKMLVPDLRIVTDGTASIKFEDGGKKHDHQASPDGRQRIHQYRGDFDC